MDLIQQEYDKYVNYTRKLLFSWRKGEARDIVHDVLAGAIKDGIESNPRIIMYRLRCAVRKKTSDKLEFTPQPPVISEPAPTMRRQDVLKAIDNLRIYRPHTSESPTVDTKKTSIAKFIVIKSIEGYESKEIAEMLGMKPTAVWDLKHKSMKRIRKMLV